MCLFPDKLPIACTTDPSCHGGINQTLQFTVPSSLAPDCPQGSMCPMFLREVTPGSYDITVQNENGTSAAAPLIITGGSSGTTPPTISGLDAPVSLPIGTPGTWTIHASVMSNSTANLHYSVVWGDENLNGGTNIMAPAPTTVQTSVSFTHAYQRSGTYTPTFTVTNDAGLSATVSGTIVVTPLY